MKPLVFVSHIHSEGELAAWLKEKVTQLLLGGIEFFVSSDKTSIVAGDKWLRNIEEAVKKSSIVIVLCSKNSIERPWINFEAGGAWFAGKRVVPLCHGGLFPSSLPEPLKSLQGLILTDPEDFRDLIVLLSREAGLLTPQFNAEDVLSTVPPHAPQDYAVPAVAPADGIQPSRQKLESLFNKLHSVVVELLNNNRTIGTGFVCEKTGLILTTDYAVRDMETDTTVRFINGNEMKADILKFDSEHGLAALRIHEDDYPYLEVQKNEPELFQEIITFGQRDRIGWFTATGRIVGKTSPKDPEYTLKYEYIQADLRTGAGFGGSPVLDTAGVFIGLVHSRLVDADVTFIIPSVACELFLSTVDKKSN